MEKYFHWEQNSDSCSPSPLVLIPSPKPAESLKPQIWGLGRACEAGLLGEIRLQSALC